MTLPRRSRWIRPSPRCIATTSSSAAAVEAADVDDEALVGHRLGPGQVGDGPAVRRLVVLPLHVGLAVEGGEVVDVDREDVVQRRREAREEAGPRRLELLAREGAHGVVQTVVGEPVGVDLGVEEIEELHQRSPCAVTWNEPPCQPALDLRPPVVAPERLAVDDEEGRTEDAVRDRVVADLAQPRLRRGRGPHALPPRRRRCRTRRPAPSAATASARLTLRVK